MLNGTKRVSPEVEKIVRTISENGGTPLVVSENEQIKGVIELQDIIKTGIRERFERLRKMGVKTVMVTGDNPLTAKYIAEQAGVDDFIAEAKPEDKMEYIKREQRAGKLVAMMGDGTNDAPALACARVGISMKSGTELAMESSDIVLMKSNPVGVAEALQLGRTTLHIIRQNLFWAFFYNIIGIPLAAGCLYPAFGLTLNPMIAAGAMSLSSLCVVFNSLRLRGFKPRLEK